MHCWNLTTVYKGDLTINNFAVGRFSAQFNGLKRGCLVLYRMEIAYRVTENTTTSDHNGQSSFVNRYAAGVYSTANYWWRTTNTVAMPLNRCKTESGIGLQANRNKRVNKGPANPSDPTCLISQFGHAVSYGKCMTR